MSLQAPAGMPVLDEQVGRGNGREHDLRDLDPEAVRFVDARRVRDLDRLSGDLAVAEPRARVVFRGVHVGQCSAKRGSRRRSRAFSEPAIMPR
jgi:hypothetical protein